MSTVQSKRSSVKGCDFCGGTGVKLESAARVSRVIRAAQKWAAFQEDDSRVNQVLDTKLAAEAARAKAALLAAIEKLP